MGSRRINPGRPMHRRLSLARLKRMLGRCVEEFTDSAKRAGLVTPCWRWQGHKDHNGYGQIKIDGRAEWCSRVSYAEFNGFLPADVEVDHVCRTRDCINPDHLRALVPAVNRADQAGPGSYANGNGRHQAGKGANHAARDQVVA